MALNAESVKALAIKYQADLGNLGTVSKQATGVLDKTQKKFTGFQKSLAGLFTGVAITAGIGAIVSAANTQEDALRQLEDRIRSTGGVAGLTAGELVQMSKSLQDVTRFGDEATQGAQAILLTFTKIGRDVFPEVIERIQDVSTVMGQDLKTSTVQLGKALNDPIANLGALSRTGIQFTKQQKELIKSLAETGRLAEAQKIILAELKTQFGGAARAAGETFAGTLAKISNAFGDLMEEMGKGITNQEGVNNQLNALLDILKDPTLSEGLKTIVSGLAAIAVEVAKIVLFFPRLIGGLQELGKQADKSFSRSAEMAEQFETNFKRQLEALEKAGVSFQKFNEITASMEGSERLKEIQVETDKLNDEISELNDVMEKASPQMRVGFLVALEKETKKLNELEAEANSILSKQLSQITKNNKAYEISDATIKKYRENLRGQLKETLDAIPPAEKLGKAVGEGGKGAGKAAKKLKEWAAAAKVANKEIPELEESSRDLKETIDAILDELPPMESGLEGVAAVTRTWRDEINELKLEDQARQAAALAKRHEELKQSMLEAFGALSTLIDGMVDILGINESAAKSFRGLTGTIESFARGDYFGGIVSGAGLVVDMFAGKDGIQDSVGAATALLEQFGITGSDSIEQFAEKLAELDFDISDLMDFDAVRDEIDQMAEDFATITPEFIQKESLAAVGELEKLVNGGANSIADLNQQISITDTLFSQMLRGGIDAGTAVTELDKVIAKLEESAGELGVTGNETLNKLKKYRKLIADNKALVESAQGLTGAFEQLGKLGAFSPEVSGDAQKNFDDFVNQAVDKYQDLIAAGFDQGQALDMLNPLFNEINKKAEDFGLTIADDAKEILNLADPAALDPMIEGLQSIADILRQIAEGMGIDLAAAAERAGNAIDDNIGRAFGNLENMAGPDFSNMMIPGMDFAGVQAAGTAAAASGGGGSTVINNKYITISPGAIATGAVQTQVDARADVNEVREIINSNKDNIMRDFKNALDNIGG